MHEVWAVEEVRQEGGNQVEGLLPAGEGQAVPPSGSEEEGPRLCACGCGEPCPAPKRLNRPRRFVNRNHAERVNQRKHQVKRNATKSKRRFANLGRVCRYCQARDDECTFYGPDRCDPCYRAAVPDRSPCPKCGGPRRQKPFYCACSPPAYLVPVIVLDKGSDRERTIYRNPQGDGVRSKNRRVSVANKHYILPRDGVLVITLPSEVWVRTRR